MRPPRLDDPEAELRLRLRQRHGAGYDIDRVVELVRKDLATQCLDLEAFLDDDDAATTNPKALTNPIGHYRARARKLVREAPIRRAEAERAEGPTRTPRVERTPEVAIEPITPLQRCSHCKCRRGTGLVILTDSNGAQRAVGCPVCNPPSQGAASAPPAPQLVGAAC